MRRLIQVEQKPNTCAQRQENEGYSRPRNTKAAAQPRRRVHALIEAHIHVGGPETLAELVEGNQFPRTFPEYAEHFQQLPANFNADSISLQFAELLV